MSAVEFPPLLNDLILRAARGEETERAPVWLMRQAGRHLPEFREMRAEHDFFEFCQTPTLACEVTLQPVRRYAGLLDAAIIFSDILVVPQAMGMTVEMVPGKGPSFPDPLRTPEDIPTKVRATVDVDKELSYVFDAITLTRRELKGQVPLIGFCGAPWTLFAYMVEGGGSKTLQLAKTWLFTWPDESKRLMERIADVCIDFLVGQIKAGAQLVQVFDSWANELSEPDFLEFSFPTLRRIATGVRAKLDAQGIPHVPMILFAKGANMHVDTLANETVYDVLGLDWVISGARARTLVDGKKALQGNFDPNIFYGSKENIEKQVKRTCEEFMAAHGGRSKAWIANLGHGVTPGVQPEDVVWLLQCVHKYSASQKA
ncbi:uroporphyrinogen decarboxylase [Auriculariales sp. MPI-PUGE-AT-0066]|nr:uroporphyrinogen decarboxylase [Auriculariales sp. MPI-PUGE-AT-0066]